MQININDREAGKNVSLNSRSFPEKISFRAQCDNNTQHILHIPLYFIIKLMQDHSINSQIDSSFT